MSALTEEEKEECMEMIRDALFWRKWLKMEKPRPCPHSLNGSVIDG